MISKLVIGNDRLCGKVILTVTLVLFVYYVTWILILPVLPIDPDSRFRRLFPEDTTLGIAVPVVAGTLFYSGLAIFALLQLRCNS